MNAQVQEKPLTVMDIPTDPQSKEFAAFRDRAAYVYVTGNFPTHVRAHFTSLLSMITKQVRNHTSIDQQQGRIQVDPEMVYKLRLDEHPMVAAVRSFVEKGYLLTRPDLGTQRRSYSRVTLVDKSAGKHIVINTDGSVSGTV